MYVEKVEVKRKIDEANDRIGRAKVYQSSDSSFRSSSSNNSINLFNNCRFTSSKIVKSELSWQTLKDKQTGSISIASLSICEPECDNHHKQ